MFGLVGSFIWPFVCTTWLVRTIQAIFGVFRAQFDHLTGAVTRS